MVHAIRIISLNLQSPDLFFQQIAQIHIEEIQSGFLSRLGENFLIKLYRCIASTQHTFLCAAVRDDQVLGFICGSTNTTKLYYAFFRRYGLSVLPALLPYLVNLKNIKRIFETLFYSQKEEMSNLSKSEILNFCVSHNAQRRGIGRRLFSELVKEFHWRGINSIKIVTGENQVSAQRFYEALGAKLVQRIEVHKGVGSVLYLYDISGETT